MFLSIILVFSISEIYSHKKEMEWGCGALFKHIHKKFVHRSEVEFFFTLPESNP
jgi:hypothetical protein